MKKILSLLALIVFVAAACNTAKAPQDSVSSTNTEPKVTEVKLAIISLENDGAHGPKVGCGDSTIYKGKTIPGASAPLGATMAELFKLRMTDTKTIDGGQVYNSIEKMPNLKFDHAALENGVAKIYLTGDTSGLGGVCDSPRVQAQIEYTAKQFSNVQSVETYLNSTPLNWRDWASQK